MLWLVLVARKSTQAFYDAFSRDYDALVGGQPDAVDARRFLCEHIQPRLVEAPTVLEAGCGTGLYSRHLEAPSGDLHGVDFSMGQLREARGKGLRMALVLGDARALPYRSESFDVVTSFELLAHFPGTESAYVTEAYRVLKPNGVFVVDPMAPAARPRRGVVRLLGPVGRAARSALVRLSNIEAWTAIPTPEYVAGILKGARFEVETHTRTYGKTWTFVVGTKA